MRATAVTGGFQIYHSLLTLNWLSTGQGDNNLPIVSVFLEYPE